MGVKGHWGQISTFNIEYRINGQGSDIGIRITADHSSGMPR